MIAIPLKQWLQWSVEERGQITQHYANIGRKWYLDSTGFDLHQEIQKDYQDEADAHGVTVAKLLR